MTKKYTYFLRDCKCFRPVLFALNNEVESQQKLIDFLINSGLNYEGLINIDKYNFSRRHLFIFGDFKLVIYWMRNLSTIEIRPNGWNGAFMECNFDHIRACSSGYSDHYSLAFCLGEYQKMTLAIPKIEVAE